MATKEERDARLDQLGEAVKSWAANRRAQLKKQADFNRRLLRGRTGSERLAQASVAAMSALTVNAINEFLTGDS